MLREQEDHRDPLLVQLDPQVRREVTASLLYPSTECAALHVLFVCVYTNVLELLKYGRSGTDLTRFSKSANPRQRPIWQVDKEACNMSTLLHLHLYNL